MEPGGHAGATVEFRVAGRQQVPGKLLHREHVERHVHVERSDHPIAVTPGERPARIFLVSIAVGVPRRVEPVASPSFAVVRRFQELVDGPLVGVGRVVGEKRIHRLRRRREADEIEARASQQRGPIRFRRRFDVLLLQFRQDEGVDRIANPTLVLDLGQRRPGDGLERPMAGGGMNRFLARRGVGPSGAVVDPGPYQGNLFRRERVARVLRRHSPRLFVEAGYEVHEPTLDALARDDHRAAIGSRERIGSQIEPQPRFLRVGTVTVVAMAREEGLHVFDEIDVALRGRGKLRQFRRRIFGERRRAEYGHAQRDANATGREIISPTHDLSSRRWAFRRSNAAR